MTGPVPGPPRPGMWPRPAPPAQPGQPGQAAPRPAPPGQPGFAGQAGQAQGGGQGPQGGGQGAGRPDLGVPDGHTGDGTGHPAVDAAVQSLDNAARLSPADQVVAFEEAHATLQETLASIDRA